MSQVPNGGLFTGGCITNACCHIRTGEEWLARVRARACTLMHPPVDRITVKPPFL